MISLPVRPLALLTALTLAMGACTGDGGTPPGPTTGTISGRVTEGATNIEGAQIGLTGGATRNATTNSSGAYTFAELAPANYSVTLTPPAGFRLRSGDTQTKTATVTAGQTSTVDWNLDRESGSEQVVVIRLTADSFIPSDTTIAPGTIVRWVNEFGILHTITPQNPNQPGVWQRMETSAQGERREHLFSVAAQTYRYRCEPHSSDFTTGMVGVIRVQ